MTSAWIAAPRPELRDQASLAFDLSRTSSAGHARQLRLFGRQLRLYANANLSIYVRQRCNAACGFCVEELRPASRGLELAPQRQVLRDDDAWLAGLHHVLATCAPWIGSVGVTGGEPSRDPLLARILAAMVASGLRRRTMTTNASGLWLPVQTAAGGRQAVADAIAESGLMHLNISRAAVSAADNAALMAMRGEVADGGGLDDDALRAAITRVQRAEVSVRLSCVLLRDGVRDRDGIAAYLAYASGLGVQNVIFRQLMRPDPQTTRPVGVARYSDRQRVELRPLLATLDGDPRWQFLRQIVGYYYYVEVWRCRVQGQAMTVTFEEADLAHIEAQKRADPGLAHELVYHPDGGLCTTWQPWDGQLWSAAGLSRPPSERESQRHA